MSLDRNNSIIISLLSCMMTLSSCKKNQKQVSSRSSVTEEQVAQKSQSNSNKTKESLPENPPTENPPTEKPPVEIPSEECPADIKQIALHPEFGKTVTTGSTKIIRIVTVSSDETFVEIFDYQITTNSSLIELDQSSQPPSIRFKDTGTSTFQLTGCGQSIEVDITASSTSQSFSNTCEEWSDQIRWLGEGKKNCHANVSDSTPVCSAKLSVYNAAIQSVSACETSARNCTSEQESVQRTYDDLLECQIGTPETLYNCSEIAIKIKNECDRMQVSKCSSSAKAPCTGGT